MKKITITISVPENAEVSVDTEAGSLHAQPEPSEAVATTHEPVGEPETSVEEPQGTLANVYPFQFRVRENDLHIQTTLKRIPIIYDDAHIVSDRSYGSVASFDLTEIDRPYVAKLVDIGVYHAHEYDTVPSLARTVARYIPAQLVVHEDGTAEIALPDGTRIPVSGSADSEYESGHEQHADHVEHNEGEGLQEETAEHDHESAGEWQPLQIRSRGSHVHFQSTETNIAGLPCEARSYGCAGDLYVPLISEDKMYSLLEALGRAASDYERLVPSLAPSNARYVPAQARVRGDNVVIKLLPTAEEVVLPRQDLPSAA